MTTAVNVAHDRQRNKATHSKKQEHPESANLRRRKKIQPKAIRDSNPDFRINPHPNVCRICYKMLWMHYLVDVTHFAKYKKGKAAYSSSWNSPQNYGTPLVNGITQCYLPPDRGDLMVQVWYKSAVDCKNNANKCPNIHYSAMVKKMKKWSGIHTLIRITTKRQSLLEGHLLPMPVKFGRRPFPRSSVILFTVYDRMTERSNNLRLVDGGNSNTQFLTDDLHETRQKQ